MRYLPGGPGLKYQIPDYFNERHNPLLLHTSNQFDHLLIFYSIFSRFAAATAVKPRDATAWVVVLHIRWMMMIEIIIRSLHSARHLAVKL